MFILNGALVALDRLSGSRPGSLWPDNQHRRAPYPHALRVIARAPPSPCRAHSLQRTPLTVRLVFWQAGSFQDHLPQRAVRIDARAATQACPYAPRLRAVCSSAHELPACPHTNSCNNIACRVHRRARWWEGEQGEQEGVVPEVRRRQPAEYRLCERRRQPAAARAPASHATALHVPALHVPPPFAALTRALPSRARHPHATCPQRWPPPRTPSARRSRVPAPHAPTPHAHARPARARPARARPLRAHREAHVRAALPSERRPFATPPPPPPPPPGTHRRPSSATGQGAHELYVCNIVLVSDPSLTKSIITFQSIITIRARVHYTTYYTMCELHRFYYTTRITPHITLLRVV